VTRTPVPTVLALLAAGCVALAVAAVPASARPSAICPHPGTINGVSVLVECGPAKATLRFGVTRLALKNGQCQKTSANFTLGFGAVVAEPTTKRPPDSFQLIAGGSGSSAASHDGSYSATVMFTRSGRNYAGETVKLTLTRKRSAGTFSGVVTSTTGTAKVKLSGSFTCS
jgi:hypothetical protein